MSTKTRLRNVEKALVAKNTLDAATAILNARRKFQEGGYKPSIITKEQYDSSLGLLRRVYDASFRSGLAFVEGKSPIKISKEAYENDRDYWDSPRIKIKIKHGLYAIGD